MKKILFSLLALSLSYGATAQDAADKQFQAGLVAGFGLNFQNMGTKTIAKDGVGNDLLIGGNLNWMFNENIGLTTGLEFEFSTTKFAPGTNSIYYYYNDTKIIGYKDFQDDPNSATHVFRIDERKQKSTYLTIPTMLIFRSKFVGYMRYFGKFGMRHSFLLSQNSHDIGSSTSLEGLENFTADQQKGMKAKNEVVFYKGSIGIAGGAEWNFSGSTTLMAEIGYYYGITPLYYNRSNSYLFTFQNENGLPVQRPLNNKASQGQLQLKISILF